MRKKRNSKHKHASVLMVLELKVSYEMQQKKGLLKIESMGREVSIRKKNRDELEFLDNVTLIPRRRTPIIFDGPFSLECLLQNFLPPALVSEKLG